jgi:hypothetical protein
MRMIRPISSRGRVRRHASVEWAVAFALVGSLLAIAVPTFVREVHASRLVEPVEGVKRLGASAIAYARLHAPTGAQGVQPFPAGAPLTPGAPPRGHCNIDPPDAWDNPTWIALDLFRPAPPGTPHCFAFGFDSALSPAKSTFRAHAHGDLDGDGVYSTFEVTGRLVEGDPRGPVLDPEMIVDSEVE